MGKFNGVMLWGYFMGKCYGKILMGKLCAAGFISSVTEYSCQ
jgi:hypothetical protein